MHINSWLRKTMVGLLCAILTIPFLSPGVAAKNNSEKVIIHVGSPSVWSIGQAHYLLAKMHRDNLALKSSLPDSTALDPNGISATKIQLLKTLLDIEAQFNQKIGVENQAELREQQFRLRQRDDARAKLQEKQQELEEADDDLAKMKKKLARMEIDFAQRETERQSKAKPKADPPVAAPLPDQEQKDLEQEIAILKKRIETKQSERNDLGTQVATLKTESNAKVEKPNLSEVTLGAGSQLPQQSDFVKDLVKKAAESIKQPRLAASLALDNFIGMQYEIIAKQLTLLRDEVGPDNRVVFLELPSSVYTVPGKGDNYLAQVQWRVTQFFQEEQDQRKSDEIMEDLSNYQPRRDYDALRQGATVPDIKGNWHPANSNSVRALDIIPRQSALNVNDVHSTVSQLNFLGILKLLVGFGVRVNYQRQQELYEQYLQQEVFASGFGKGLHTFGWTFGPLPGSNRISPGVKTTYAVLSVPKNTSLLRLEARGVAYPRKDAPSYEMATKRYLNDDQVVAKEDFTIIVPNKRTEHFGVSEVRYTPAQKGDPVTVVVRGDYFSPQIGVLVDGVPLSKALSLGFTATSEAVTDTSLDTRVKGQFELTSSRELILKFSRGDKYIGTPNITLVTPEKSASINYFRMLVNGLRGVSLVEVSVVEPMFMDDFSLEEKPILIDKKTDPHIRMRLKGTGLRPRADIWINNRLIAYKGFSGLLQAPGRFPVERYIATHQTDQFVTQTDTGEYFVYFTPTAADQVADKWQIRFRQQSLRSFEAKDFVHSFPKDPKDPEVEVINYAADSSIKKAILDVRILSDKPHVSASLSPARDGRIISRPTGEGGKKFRAVFAVNFQPQGNKMVEKSKVSITVVRSDGPKDKNKDVKTYDLPLNVRPQIVRVTISPPLKPEEEGALITIQGINLQQVDKVLVAEQEAAIISGSDSETLVIRLKKGVFVKQEEGLQIPVVLVLKDGTKVSALVEVNESTRSRTEYPTNIRKNRRH